MEIAVWVGKQFASKALDAQQQLREEVHVIDLPDHHRGGDQLCQIGADDLLVGA